MLTMNNKINTSTIHVASDNSHGVDNSDEKTTPHKVNWYIGKAENM